VDSLFSSHAAAISAAVPELISVLSVSEQATTQNSNILKMQALIHGAGLGNAILTATTFVEAGVDDIFNWLIPMMGEVKSKNAISQGSFDKLQATQAEEPVALTVDDTIGIIQEIFNRLSGDLKNSTSFPIPELRGQILEYTSASANTTLQTRLDALNDDLLEVFRAIESAVYGGTSITTRPLGVKSRDVNPISIVTFYGLGPGKISELLAEGKYRTDKGKLEQKIKERLVELETNPNNATKNAETAKTGYEKAKEAYYEVGDPNMLLHIATKYNPKNATASTLKVATVKKEIGADGVITYSVTSCGAASQDLRVLGAMNDALAHLNIAYYSLAICYERALIVGELVRIKVREIEDANDLVRINNEYLKKLINCTTACTRPQ
jgi:hypothetical protein